MRLIYSGPHPVVVVDELDPTQEIKAGEPVNVPDELGARLLEQDTWADASDDTSAAGKAAAAAQAREDQEKAAADAAAKAADASDNTTKGDS